MPNKTISRKLETVISRTKKSIKTYKGEGMVCDALFQVLVYRDTEGLFMDVMSVDGDSLKPMPFKDLYQMWVATAGYLFRLPVEETPEILKIKRFLLITLNRMQLDGQLRRLEELKAANPDVPESELVKQIISSEKAIPE